MAKGTLSYLMPKTTAGNFGKVERKRGMFVNVSSYPQLGGFSGPDKLKQADPPMVLEKHPSARAGKPI